MMPHYLLDTRQLWGDYGDNLINASSSRLVNGTDPLALSRLGPFVPPLFKSATNFLVIENVKTRTGRRDKRDGSGSVSTLPLTPDDHQVGDKKRDRSNYLTL
jgi:hypothetical protein